MRNLFNTSNILGTVVLISILTFGGYFLGKTINNFRNPDSAIAANQVWCSNCQKYHDKATATQEAESQKLIWCVNCKTYHAPDKDN